MRNNKLKAVREKWSHSKFFIGKNRVLSKALGGTEEEEYAEGLSMVARYNSFNLSVGIARHWQQVKYSVVILYELK